MFSHTNSHRVKSKDTEKKDSKLRKTKNHDWEFRHPVMQEVNVKVAVRVRPLLAKEKLGSEQICVRLVPNNNQVIVGGNRGFTFDFALSPKATQEDCYNQCVEPLVRSIFEGYNSTVFAYGQTGSGKTYTIGGGDISCLTEDEYGVIPRALHQMFKIMEDNDHVQYAVRVSYVEIYMEEVRDLLDLDTSPKDLHVREDENGNTVIVGAREEEVSCLDEVMSLLESGSAARHTGSTLMNEQSSRSHSVFTVLIGQQWSDVDPMAESRTNMSFEEQDDEISHFMSGKFHFVDLAGSERAHRTGNVGDRFKESIHINSGLLSLGNVISALGDPKKRSNHIPYRESKITRILKDSLGGNAKTVMICCISPASSNFDETLNALKYANRARNIRNVPIINRDIQSIRFEEMQTEIMALREELKRQKTNMQLEPTESFPDHTTGQVQELEQKIVRLETECAHYRTLAEEAYKHLTEIQSCKVLSENLDLKVQDWMALMEEMKNKVPLTMSAEDVEGGTIKDLQTQLNQCRLHLRSDEALFTEKAKENNKLTEQLQEMERQAQESAEALGEWQTKVQEQQQQLVQQQLRIQELEAGLMVTALNESSVMESETVSSLPLSSARRPKSVPAHIHSTSDKGGLLRPPSRTAKTSPAVFSVDRVMQSFRARSQLLVTHLEDADEVLHQTFSDDEEQDNQAQDHTRPTESTLERKGTFRVKKNKRRSRLQPLQPQPRAQASESKPPSGHAELRLSDSSSSNTSTLVDDTDEFRLINVDSTSSTELQRKKIKKAQLKMLEANQKVRDLNINIKMKEQLICELVKNGKDAELMNKQYAEKIKDLEREKEQARQEVMDMQQALQDLEAKEQQETAEKARLQQDYKKKIEAAMQKVTALQQKQKDTEKVANFANSNVKKIHDLESAVERMKQQQETLQKKLKHEAEQKAKLERDMQKEVQRVKELELRTAHQQKVLKRKTEEIAAAQRRLRSNSISSTAAAANQPSANGESFDRLEEQRRLLDADLERVLHERQTMVELQQELKKKETILAKREAMLAEKSELEVKKMRSSSLLTKERDDVTARLGSIEKTLTERCQDLTKAKGDQLSKVKEEIKKLQQKRDKLHSERQALDNQLHEGKILSSNEERRLIELEEGMDAIDAAIQYKNEGINTKQVELRQSQILMKSEDNLINRLSSLSVTETRSLLSRYFDKVISLRENLTLLNQEKSENEMKNEELERLVHELENALQKSALEVDRKLTQQQQEYERKVHLLMQQIMTQDSRSERSGGDRGDGGSSVGGGSGGGGSGRGSSVKASGAASASGSSSSCVVNGEVAASSSSSSAASNDAKIVRLEKELYFYKKTSRDLKKTIRELVSSGRLHAQLAEEMGVNLVSNSVQSLADGEPSTPRDRDVHQADLAHRLLCLSPDSDVTEEEQAAVECGTAIEAPSPTISRASSRGSSIHSSSSVVLLPPLSPLPLITSTTPTITTTTTTSPTAATLATTTTTTNPYIILPRIQPQRPTPPPPEASNSNTTTPHVTLSRPPHPRPSHPLSPHPHLLVRRPRPQLRRATITTTTTNNPINGRPLRRLPTIQHSSRGQRPLSIVQASVQDQASAQSQAPALSLAPVAVPQALTPRSRFRGGICVLCRRKKCRCEDLI